MATRSESILTLLNQIHTDHQLVLPDIQRDFVWTRDQIRALMDSIMRGYPFGSLLFWQTRFKEVPYRDFVKDWTPRLTFTPRSKSRGTALKMVLDGQQRLQSLYIAVYGSHDGRRLYFNVTSGPGTESEDVEGTEGIGTAYRFEFWREDDSNRPKRLLLVSDIISWSGRLEDTMIDKAIDAIPLVGEDASRARSNMRLLRKMVHQSDLVPVETIDEDATSEDTARTIDEILDIFVRVNTGGTRLSRSDLMFSLLKSKWQSARSSFDELLNDVQKRSPLNLDKDFVIRGLLTVTDAPVTYDVDNVKRNWDKMEAAFDQFGKSLKSTLDFCMSSDARIMSASLVDPLNTLFPIIYYLYQFPNGSVPEVERKNIRSFLLFALFNNFTRSEARIRYLRAELLKSKGAAFPLQRLLNVISDRQRNHYIFTSDGMVNENRRLALNIVQPAVARETFSWQERAEMDHIFPQSVMRPKYGDLVDDIGNLSYLGKLRNIRKSAEMPELYFESVSDDQLRDDYCIGERALLAEDKFPEFVESRRKRIVDKVKEYLGR